MDFEKHDPSVTSMKHHVLKALEPSPFFELCVDGFDGSSAHYTYDEFRRLYNDAVESMMHYRYLLSKAKDELEESRNEANNYYLALMEQADL